MNIIVLFGPPGSGKGTQAKILSEKFHLEHISTGDLFRYNIKNNTKLGQEAQSYINKGNLVPDELTTEMLIDELRRNSSQKGFILDGYPRTKSQAETLDKLLNTIFRTQVDVTLALYVKDEILVKRILKRSEASERLDDADESIIRNRINEYYEKTAVVSNYYKQQHKLVELDGEGNIEEITAALSKEIEKFI
ncbi:adenylate kinase [Apibacter mensalis]|uniref:Adenylate kinase n=1 Tax=Apibacter mensalis TaxID=1586267 RepID=A0A0X3AN74_9FLAO|nr:adenylate kinase [Apibacter mensalis]CVK15515.1 adenylate kinase [Apibacter mensalis]